MTRCSYCDGKIEFLPFKCRYCGKMYCKKHRLPEKHACSFDFKTIPFIFDPENAISQKNFRGYSKKASSSYPLGLNSRNFKIERSCRSCSNTSENSPARICFSVVSSLFCSFFGLMYFGIPGLFIGGLLGALLGYFGILCY